MAWNVVPLRRALAFACAALIVGATLVPADADARAGRGGSFGSRGSKTFSAPPPTATAPGAAPMQRSITQPGATAPSPGIGGAAAAQRRPGLFGGGLGAGIMGGLLGAGLFGLLAGSGFFGGLGSLSSIFGLLIQVALIVIVVRLVMGWMRRRKEQQQPALAGAAAGAGGPSSYRYEVGGGSAGSPEARPSSADGYGGSSAALGAVQLDAQDFEAFERLLSDVQDAWSRQDLSRLRALATPEMVETFGEDLAADASRGVVNKVGDVKLLQGDLAESWSERGRDYATVAMRYELTDVTEEVGTGRVVDGDPSEKVEATELWTFLRAGANGRWLLSAIQQAA
ncbi:TIM44-like domain-containing protein [Hansschlegelia sp. KR7-227]|uniref:TIM44-like domain-containing protein n=1 Tax=Hansschlegelia sp. KR7-227 TaxID=3400914 RepID=UPI003BFF2636